MRILREIESRGGIAAAAEALYLSPSAVSQQMAVLEREAGVSVLERHGRRVRLTAAGHKLLACAVCPRPPERSWSRLSPH